MVFITLETGGFLKVKYTPTIENPGVSILDTYQEK